jgi:hypothetical protein
VFPALLFYGATKKEVALSHPPFCRLAFSFVDTEDISLGITRLFEFIKSEIQSRE